MKKLFSFVIIFLQWGNSDDRLAIVGVGFASIAAFWASINLVTVIQRQFFLLLMTEEW